MILYSIAPQWLVAAQPEDCAPQEEMPFPGGFLQGRRTPEGFRVSRVISTDPSAYLGGGPAPGTLYNGPEDRSAGG